MYPLQRRRLVEQTVIARGVPPGLLRQFRMYKKTKNSQPVVHAHNNDTMLCEMRAILPRLGSRARNESSAINPYHHRKLRAASFRRSPHVQKQAVFAGAGVAKNHVAKNVSLHAVRTELRGVAHARPFRRR